MPEIEPVSDTRFSIRCRGFWRRATLLTHWLYISVLLGAITPAPDLAARSRKPKKATYSHASLTPYVGYWEGLGAVVSGITRYRSRLALSVTEDSVLLEVDFRGFYTRAKLKPLGIRDGVIHLEVERVESSNAPKGLEDGIRIDPIEMVLKTPSTGPVEVRLDSPLPVPEPPKSRRRSRRPPPRPPDLDKRLRFLGGRLTKALTLSDPRFRPYGGTGFIRYADWRTLASGDMDWSEIRREEADRRVAEDIRKLQNDGWKCLSQVNRFIPAKSSLNLKMESSPGTPRLHLIYSRIPGPRIVYSASKQPAGYLRVNYAGGLNYPIILSETGWTTHLIMTTQPAAGSLDRLSQSIPVTVFIFGKTFGDYGTGCNLEEFGLENVRQFNEYVQILGKIALAMGLEAVRRESVESEADLLQAFATVGRNVAIESALRNIFPEATEEAIGYFGRWAGLLVSRDFTVLSLFRDTAREALLQQINRDHPEYATHAQLIDLLVDLHLQRQALPGGKRDR